MLEEIVIWYEYFQNAVYISLNLEGKNSTDILSLQPDDGMFSTATLLSINQRYRWPFDPLEIFVVFVQSEHLTPFNTCMVSSIADICSLFYIFQCAYT
jgi:hypothetical protein